MCGCAVHELHKDQDLIRTTLLDLYTNQIMDNLVRAANGMPIIQLDYNQAQANVTIKNTVGGTESQAVTASNVLALPAASLMATRTIMTTLMGNLSNENTNQVAVSAQPVITSNEVYDAYLEYLTLPGSLMVSHDPPPPGAAHLCKKCDGRYFWVPVFRRSDFFKLALLTTAQRGKTLLPPDVFFSVTVQSIEEERQAHSSETKYLILRLDKAIPNDAGTLLFDVDANKADKEQARYTLKKYAKGRQFVLTDASYVELSKDNRISKDVLQKLNNNTLRNVPFESRADLLLAVCRILGAEMTDPVERAVLETANISEEPSVSSNTSLVTVLVIRDFDQGGNKVEDGNEAKLRSLVGTTAKIFLEHRQPTATSTNDLINKVNFNLQQIQFNQLRTITDP